jgi:chemotaxis family two-component system response regulator Rcp1
VAATVEPSDVHPIRVLIVEDNPGDVVLFEESIRDARILVSLAVAEDGDEALRMLEKPDDAGNSYRPEIVFLDLNLPKKNGFEVLAKLRANKKYDAIPIVIMTSSDAEQDIARGYSLRANAYITKPVDLEQFARVLKTTKDFWFNVVRYPQGENHA